MQYKTKSSKTTQVMNYTDKVEKTDRLRISENHKKRN